MQSPYTEDYFLRGKASGLSLYEDYRWLPDLTLPMVRRIIDHLGIQKEDRILDFGCSRGYVVKAFRHLGYAAHGIDISDWAITNCDPDVKDFVSLAREPREDYDWIIAKDVLEHIEPNLAMVTPERPFTTGETINKLCAHARKGIFIVVPLSESDWTRYVVPEYEKDVTHVVRWTLPRWVEECSNYCGVDYDGSRAKWEIDSRYLIEGIKENYAQWEKGNGFITARRI